MWKWCVGVRVVRKWGWVGVYERVVVGCSGTACRIVVAVMSVEGYLPMGRPGPVALRQKYVASYLSDCEIRYGDCVRC